MVSLSIAVLNGKVETMVHVVIVEVLSEGARQVTICLMEALDPNHDHVISAEEIQAAATALLKARQNGDGELSEDEFSTRRGTTATTTAT
ncbi:MAG: EF-hand domain-containing protein [Pirellulaceae bacterium]